MTKRMKPWTFQVTEHGLMGSSTKEVTVQAATEKSAWKKLWEVCGNRTWDNVVIK